MCLCVLLYAVRAQRLETIMVVAEIGDLFTQMFLAADANSLFHNNFIVVPHDGLYQQNMKGIKIKTKETAELINEFKQMWYQGDVNGDKIPHGNGKQFYNNGDIFEGLFENGQKKCGLLTYNQAKSAYKGQFKNDLFHGQGEEYYSNERIFIGQYQMGYRKYGTEHSPDGTFVGMYKDGKRFQGYLQDGSMQIKCGQWQNNNLVRGSIGKIESRVSKIPAQVNINQKRYHQYVEKFRRDIDNFEHYYQKIEDQKRIVMWPVATLKNIHENTYCLENSKISNIFLKKHYVLFPELESVVVYDTIKSELLVISESTSSGTLLSAHINNFKAFVEIYCKFKNLTSIDVSNIKGRQLTLTFSDSSPYLRLSKLLKSIVKSIIKTGQINIDEGLSVDSSFESEFTNVIVVNRNCLENIKQ